MTDSATTGHNGDVHGGGVHDEPAGGQFDERLSVPWYHWLIPLTAAVLLAAEVHKGFPVIPFWLPYLVTVPLAVWIMLRMGRTRVRVRDGELWVSDAHLPLEFVGEVGVIHHPGKRKALGPNLDPSAFVLHRGWVGSLVRVRLTDPNDPTPYWLFSVRSAERLAEILRAAH